MIRNVLLSQGLGFSCHERGNETQMPSARKRRGKTNYTGGFSNNNGIRSRYVRLSKNSLRIGRRNGWHLGLKNGSAVEYTFEKNTRFSNGFGKETSYLKRNMGLWAELHKSQHMRSFSATECYLRTPGRLELGWFF
jgi:hypothetical protein